MLSDDKRRRRRARSVPMRRQKARIRLYGIPTETYLNGGSYTSNLAPGRRRGEGKKARRNDSILGKLLVPFITHFRVMAQLSAFLFGDGPRGAIAPPLFALFLAFSEETGRAGNHIRDRASSFGRVNPFICIYRHKDHFLLRGTPRQANLRFTC